MTTSGNTGPNVGNRRRQTLRNNASKQSPNGFQAPASSATMVSSGDQLAANRYQYLAQLAALKAQRPLIGQQYGLAVTDARTAAVGNMGAAEGAALDRGTLGGSNDMEQRSAVIAQRTRAILDASSVRTQAKLALGQQAIDARSQYYMNAAGIQNQLSQDAMANTISAFQNDMFGTILAQKTGRQPRQRQGTTPVAPASQPQQRGFTHHNVDAYQAPPRSTPGDRGPHPYRRTFP